MENLTWIVHHGSEIVNLVTTLVAVCAAIAALTPTPKDDEALGKLRKVVDLIAMNWGYAKNLKK